MLKIKSLEIMTGYIGRLMVIIGLFGILQALCVYVAMSTVVDKTVHRAETTGFLQRNAFDEGVRNMTILKAESIRVEEVEPFWGTASKKLGSPIRLAVVYDLIIPVLGGSVHLQIESSGSGVNTGYYGSGY